MLGISEVRHHRNVGVTLVLGWGLSCSLLVFNHTFLCPEWWSIVWTYEHRCHLSSGLPMGAEKDTQREASVYVGRCSKEVEVSWAPD